MPESESLLTQQPPTGAIADVALLRHVMEQHRPEALADLYDRHAPTLLALSRRILGTSADAEEVLQEVFLHVWNHAERYDPARSSVSTWLVLLTRSRAIDRLRTRKVVERTHESAHQAEPVRHTSPEGVESVLFQERRERVAHELGNCRPSSGRSWRWPSTKGSPRPRSPRGRICLSER